MPRKRGNGEGTVYKRSDGRYCAQETIEGKRLTAYGKNKTEALAKLKKKVKERLTSGNVRPEKKNCLVSEYVIYFINSIPLTNDSTREHYKVMQRRIVKLVGDLRMNQITSNSINELTTDMSRKLYAKATIQATAKFYMRILKHAQREGYINSSIEIAATGKYRNYQKPYDLPSIADTVEALRGIRPVGMRYLGLFCLYTGLRRGELIGLKWADINIETGLLSVKRNYTCTAVTHRLTPKAPKNGNEQQKVQIPLEGMKLLRELKDLYEEKGIRSEFVFCDKNGEHLRPDSVTATLHRAISKVSPHGSVHILRHLYATVLAKEGVPLRTISKQLRHSSIVTTSIYINSMQDEVYDELKDISLPGCSTIAVKNSKSEA